MPFSKSYQLTLTKRYGVVAERDAQPSSSIEQAIHFRGFTLDMQKYYYHLLWKATRTRIYNIFLEVNAVVNHSWVNSMKNIKYLCKQTFSCHLMQLAHYNSKNRRGLRHMRFAIRRWQRHAGIYEGWYHIPPFPHPMSKIAVAEEMQKKKTSQEYVLQNIPY